MKKISLIYVLLFFAMPTFAQQLSGRVMNAKGVGKLEPLIGANVYWSPSLEGTTTDAEGNFSIRYRKDSTEVLVISYTGFRSDTLRTIENEPIMVVLKDEVALKEFELNERGMSTTISTIKPVNMETIGEAEIKKAACCNLSESFESNASVDVVFADAITGARTIQMLGLSGVYTQLLSENVPMTRGLSANYGLQYVPGTWVQAIQITKGVGSVVNGFESMSGQINIEFLKPENEKTERLFVNVYGNTMSRAEANIHLNKKFNEKVSTLLFLHGSGNFMSDDINKDGFMNFPETKQLNVMNRWKIQGKKSEQVLLLRAVYDNRLAGQMHFSPEHKGTTHMWGSEITTRVLEGSFKNGFLFPNSPTASLGIITSGKHHRQESYFGLKNYNAEQNSAYANIIFNDVFGNTNHAYKTGLSFMYDKISEQYIDTTFGTEELIPGAFFEYTYTHLNNFTMLLGLREDYHNLYGWKFTPRAHLRYQPIEDLTLRASAGTGFRSPHVIMENTSTLVSNRTLFLANDLLAEESFNVGGSMNYLFKLKKRSASLNIDYYYTNFTNQVIVDFDKSLNELHIYNLKGVSFSHSIQAELDVEIIKGLTVKTAYKHYLVKQQYLIGVLDKPFIPRDRVMFNVSYHTNNKKWKFDFISNWFGSTRIPTTAGLSDEEKMPERSKEYLIMHFQVTKLFRHFEWYLGAENLLNFTQTNAIIGEDNPFGSSFDASMVWGPLSGRVVYSGIRLSIR